MDNRPIGVFDSGVGGLTVASQIIKRLKNEKIVYFGDTARVPYGTKTRETVTKFSKQDVRFLLSQNVKAIVVACNTASANSLSALKETFDVPIFGVVEPGAEEALRMTKNKKVGIIATSSTIKSNAFQNAIHDRDAEVKVFAKACPLFVPLAEEGLWDDEITKLTVKKYLNELIYKDVDTILMGCTHYPLLRGCIQETVGRDVMLVEPAKEVSVALESYLRENDMLCQGEEEKEHSFFISDRTDMFEKICEEALKKKYTATEIDIEKY